MVCVQELSFHENTHIWDIFWLKPVFILEGCLAHATPTMAGILPGRKRFDAFDALGAKAVDRLYTQSVTDLAGAKNDAREGFDEAVQQLKVHAPPAQSMMEVLEERTMASAQAEQGYTSGGPGRYYRIMAKPDALDAGFVMIPPVGAEPTPQQAAGFAMEVRRKLGTLSALNATEIKTEPADAAHRMFSSVEPLADAALVNIANGTAGTASQYGAGIRALCDPCGWNMGRST